MKIALFGFVANELQLVDRPSHEFLHIVYPRCYIVRRYRRNASVTSTVRAMNNQMPSFNHPIELFIGRRKIVDGHSQFLQHPSNVICVTEAMLV